MLSQTAQYAVRAMIYLAGREDGPTVRVEEVASALGVPRNYLSKILHTLGKRGLLDSLRGPRGGFRLARPASSVTLFEVVEPFDDIEARRTCLLGRKECSDVNPCAVHAGWREAATQIARYFRETTLADVVREAERLGGIVGGR